MLSLSEHSRYHFRDGQIFLGVSHGIPVGIDTPRHAITFAGSRSGKGAACIIPNLKRWPHNAIVVDPKGEAAEQTCADREAMGQAVHVIDPFEFANIPDRFRSAYNPLTDIDPDSLTVREKIQILSDGLIMRHEPRHKLWDDNAQTILSGLIAFVRLAEPEERQTLVRVREILLTDEFEVAIEEMAKWPQCGKLMMNAARAASDPDQGAAFTGNARYNTEWLDTLAMQSSLDHSDFSMRSLKRDNCTIYLVLPPDFLDEHGRFLRMFIRCALGAMGEKIDGALLHKRCLFILDEFYSLGKIDQIAKASGQMPGMGVHLWPFLQDLGQLTSLYGQEGAETFFGNADLHQFFANTDQTTLEYMSKLTGKTRPDELGLPPTAPALSQGPSFVGSMMQASQKGSTRAMGAGWSALSGALQSSMNAETQAEYQTQMSLYQQRMANAGQPRYSPDEMAKMVQRRDDSVADRMLCVLNGADMAFVAPLPYFRAQPRTLEEKNEAWIKYAETLKWKYEHEKSWPVGLLFSFIIASIYYVWWVFLDGHSGSLIPPKNVWKFGLISAGFYGLLSFPFTWIIASWLKKHERQKFYNEEYQKFMKNN